MLIRIYTDFGDVRETTLDRTTYEEFGRDARRYVDHITAPLPKNRYHGLEVFEDEEGKRKVAEWGEVQAVVKMDKREILRKYDTFIELIEALESCFDLEDAGYCDRATQENYLELEALKATDLLHEYKKAKANAYFGK